MRTQSPEPLLPLLGHGEIEQIDACAETQSLYATWHEGSVVFDQRRWRCRRAELQWVAPAHLIVVTRHGGTKRTRVEIEGGAAHDGADRPGVVSFIPAGTARQASYDRPDLIYAALWVDPAFERLSSVKTPLERRHGHFVNHDLADYHMAAHADAPNVDAVFLEEFDDKANPLGAKGLGELGNCGASAAVANAVYNATGVRVRSLPITLDKLLPKLPA